MGGELKIYELTNLTGFKHVINVQYTYDYYLIPINILYHE